MPVKNLLWLSKWYCHDTRARNDLRADFLRLNRSFNETLHYAPAFYNKLPLQVRTLPANVFKTVIKNYLVGKAFYDFKLFLSDTVCLSDFNV